MTTLFRLLVGYALAKGAVKATLKIPGRYEGIEDVLVALNRIVAPCVAVEISEAEFRRLNGWPRASASAPQGPTS